MVRPHNNSDHCEPWDRKINPKECSWGPTNKGGYLYVHTFNQYN